jgi:hypothetical protein
MSSCLPPSLSLALSLSLFLYLYLSPLSQAGDTMLHIAAKLTQSKRDAIIQLLLKAGADPTIANAVSPSLSLPLSLPMS